MKLKIFIGWDPREEIAWEVCKHSILSRTNTNSVEIYPLVQADLRAMGVYNRPEDKLAATEFSLTRFLTPHLAGNTGYAIFVDCDFLFLTDIYKIIDEIDPSNAVSVVKHDYTPRETIKMDGCIQHNYPRKNWSSLMVFNCSHNSLKILSPNYVNSATPSNLHRFQWVSDDEIGDLDIGWNFLDGIYESNYLGIKAIHYTLGGPWFKGQKKTDLSTFWVRELHEYLEKNMAEA